MKNSSDHKAGKKEEEKMQHQNAVQRQRMRRQTKRSMS
jgi:hypothetical protein